jgi:hypothetical protein
MPFHRFYMWKQCLGFRPIGKVASRKSSTQDIDISFLPSLELCMHFKPLLRRQLHQSMYVEQALAHTNTDQAVRSQCDNIVFKVGLAVRSLRVPP